MIAKFYEFRKKDVPKTMYYYYYFHLVMTSLPCECRSCQMWEVDDHILITCHYTECICSIETTFKCGFFDGEATAKPRYVCPRMGLKNCGYYNVVGNEYFKEYGTIVEHAKEYLKDVKRYTCACGKPTKVVVEKVSVGARTLGLNDELQLFYKCKNDTCTYKQSVPQVESTVSRLRCVCGTCCKFDGGIYSCQMDASCGTYFHELDSITFMQTAILERELDEHAFVHLPTTARELSCGKKGILKFKYNNHYTNGQLLLVCKDLFCENSLKAILQPY